MKYVEGGLQVSWYYRGMGLRANSNRTFNVGDSLNLACVGQAGFSIEPLIFAINKASIPANLHYTPGNPSTFTVTDEGRLIYDDYNGVAAGHENFAVIRYQNEMTNEFGKGSLIIRAMSLTRADAGTYHCSAVMRTDPSLTYTSGALNLVINLKPGQARSTRSTIASKLVTYSAVVLTASKLVF